VSVYSNNVITYLNVFTGKKNARNLYGMRVLSLSLSLLLSTVFVINLSHGLQEALGERKPPQRQL